MGPPIAMNSNLPVAAPADHHVARRFRQLQPRMTGHRVMPLELPGNSGPRDASRHHHAGGHHGHRQKYRAAMNLHASPSLTNVMRQQKTRLIMQFARTTCTYYGYAGKGDYVPAGRSAS